MTAACPANVWCLFSGGKDSRTVARELAEQGRLAGCVFLGTGVCTPDIEPFVRKVCDDEGWPLKVYRTPDSYEEYVAKLGFPGPSQHGAIMNRLKGRGVRMFKKAHPGETLASGVRLAESGRRRQWVSDRRDFEGVPVEAPIKDWSTEQVWAYVRKHNLEVSPAYKTLHISGDCLCGSFSERSEVPIIEMFYPELADRLFRLEERLDREGVVPVEFRRWGWGKGGGFSAARRSSRLEDFLCQACTGA